MRKIIFGTSFTFLLFSIVSFVLGVKDYFEMHTVFKTLVACFGMNLALFALDKYLNSKHANLSQNTLIVNSNLSLEEFAFKLKEVNNWQIVSTENDSLILRTGRGNFKSFGDRIVINSISKTDVVNIYSIKVENINPLNLYEFGNSSAILNNINKYFESKSLRA